MKTAILSITSGGRALAEEIAASLPGSFPVPVEGGVSRTLADRWREVDAFICIMAAGIVVRTIAPLLDDKKNDPCIVVLDEKGRFAVSLLSGHLGGGNELANRVAGLTGGQAVITTASDTLGLPALDLWARDQGLMPEDDKALTRASARMVERGCLRLFSEVPVDFLPEGLSETADSRHADLIISRRTDQPEKAAVLRPRNLVVGIGCNRRTPAVEFEEALTELFDQSGLSILSIRSLASIDLKNGEPGLLDFAGRHNWRIEFHSREELNTVKNLAVSAAALKAVGAHGVAEPAALLSVRNSQRPEENLSEKLIIRKRKWSNVTMAVAVADFTLSAPAPALRSI